MLRLASEVTNPGDLNSPHRELSLVEIVVSDTRRPPGHPGPRGLKRLHGSRGAATGHDVTDGLSKGDLRRLAEAKRGCLHGMAPDAGEALARLAELLSVSPGAVVSGYWPIRSEIDPRPLLRRLASAGARIVLPATPPPDTQEGLSFHLWTPGEPLVSGRFGLREPAPSAPAIEPDWVLAPLLAFDRSGGRIGYGAGYYDRTLKRLREHKFIRAIGLAFAGQEIAAAPQGPQDQRLDAILTEHGLIEVC